MNIKELAIIVTNFREYARWYLNTTVKSFMFYTADEKLVAIFEHDKTAIVTTDKEELPEECTLQICGYLGWKYKDSAPQSFQMINAFVKSLGYSIVDIDGNLPSCDSPIYFKIKKGFGHYFNFLNWCEEHKEALC